MITLWHNLMLHPALSFLLLALIGIWALHELFCWIYPIKRASNHWGQDIGFKARDPDDLFRACEGEDDVY